MGQGLNIGILNPKPKMAPKKRPSDELHSRKGPEFRNPESNTAARPPFKKKLPATFIVLGAALNPKPLNPKPPSPKP